MKCECLCQQSILNAVLNACVCNVAGLLWIPPAVPFWYLFGHCTKPLQRWHFLSSTPAASTSCFSSTTQLKLLEILGPGEPPALGEVCVCYWNKLVRASLISGVLLVCLGFSVTQMLGALQHAKFVCFAVSVPLFWNAVWVYVCF